MLLMRVNAAVGQQSKQVQLRLPRLVHRLKNGGMREKFSTRNQRIDARNVHPHHAPGADVQMPHFAVAHLSIRQSDKMIRRMQQRVRILPQQLVIHRLARQRDGVIVCLRAISPPIQNRQYNRLFWYGHNVSH